MSIAEDKGGGHRPAPQKFGKRGGGTQIKVPNREKALHMEKKTSRQKKKPPPPHMEKFPTIL